MANLLTLARIALIVPLTAMFFINAAWAMTAALVIFIIAASTDFLDGYIARVRGGTPALGAALDPLADKLLVAAALILLIRNGVIAGAGVAAALIIILREILVGGLREAVSLKGASLPVTGLAKAKTAAQLIAVGLLLASAPGGVLGEGARPLAAGAFWLAAMLTLWTGADYSWRAAGLLNDQGGRPRDKTGGSA